MILIFVQKLTPRKNYIFHQILKGILGLEIKFTSKIEEFVASKDYKLSYGKGKMGNEFFVKSAGLLEEQGISPQHIEVSHWGEAPCFFEVGEESDIPFDIFSAAFYMLSRYEEFLPHQKNEKGLFPATESLAYKNKFLTQPVVDLWAFMLKSKLNEYYPEIAFGHREFKVQNVLSVAELYKYKKKGFMRIIGGGLRDLLRLRIKDLFERMKTLLFFEKDPYDVYKSLLQFSKQYKIPWIFMFQLSDYSIHNKNIGHNRLAYHSLIKSMGDYGQIGLLLGYEAIFDLKILRKEKKRWESIANRELEVAMVNDYELNLPDLYNNYEAAEIAGDYSMGFVDKIGFRAGTCTPFPFYELNLERISALTLYPTAFNSEAFRPSSFFEVKTTIDKIKKQVEDVGGQLIILFKNSDFSEEQRGEKFLQILERMNAK